MSTEPIDAGSSRREVPTFCPLCVSRCGAVATVVDGVFDSLRPDPAHPTGAALCVKGKAAPEIVGHADRLLHPMRRTTPKGSGDPGWERIGWDEALDTVAAHLTRLAAESGPESVVFGSSSPSTSAMSDSMDWLNRLRRAFGSPNLANYMELCGWGRRLAPLYTYGAAVPGAYRPDIQRAGALLFWGFNPSIAWLAQATASTAALRRGARLVVVDPRRAGLATKADHWLRVRPGTDAALALAMTHAMLENGWYDADFVRRWTNATFLVRSDTGRLLRASDLDPSARPGFVAWDEEQARPVRIDPSAPGAQPDAARLALRGTHQVNGVDGPLDCRPVFDLLAEGCAAMGHAVAETVTGVPASDIVAAARTVWDARPVAMYTWSGIEQQSNATQTVRAIGQLYALTGSLDVPGGNVLFTPVPTNPVDGFEFLSPAQRARTIGLERRPLGPARFEFVTGDDLYTAALEGRPYRARGLVNFGANLVMANGDSSRGREALASLDFMVHTDLFLTPTADLADIVLPAAAAFEHEALRVGFEISQEAVGRVQLRTPVQPPAGEARSDQEIIFALACRLGLSDRFFGGDMDAGWRHQLAPSGVSLEELRRHPEGVQVALATRYRKYADLQDGTPRGFRTPSRRIELFSETLAEHGYPPLPTFEEPAIGPVARPDLAARFPLVLTCAKSLRFAETQHRQVASLRGAAPDPLVEIHPDTAAANGVAAGDWVLVETPKGRVRAKARLNRTLDPSVVCGQHGWWQECTGLGLPGYPPYGPDSANLNLVLAQTPSDPISGSSPLRASLCAISPAGPD
ncbi:MAG TPA: molybdopterin-dependent oxidoreductase [Propionibacteriaceae bacterium]|nr:molybdopterin-dependent oxidoreductase [Propionibacteriaceae bacterium]